MAVCGSGVLRAHPKPQRHPGSQRWEVQAGQAGVPEEERRLVHLSPRAALILPLPSSLQFLGF